MKFIREDLELILKEREEENVALRRQIRRYKMKIASMEDTSRSGSLASEDLIFSQELQADDWFLEDNIFMLKKVFEVSPSGIIVTNSSGIIQIVNESACRLFGYSLLEFKSMKVDTLVPRSVKNHSQLVNNYFNNPSKKNMGLGRDIHGRRRDGSIFPIEVGLSHFEIEGEKYAMVSIIDLTYREKLKESLSKSNKVLLEKQKELEVLINNFPGIIFQSIIAENTIIRDIIGMSEWLTGYTLEDFRTGKVTLETLIAPVYLYRRNLVIRQAIKDHNEYEIEYLISRKDQVSVWVIEKGKYFGIDKQNRPIINACIISRDKKE